MRGQQPDTDEAVPRIEFDFADLGREEDHQVLPIPSLNAVDVGSEILSATLCPTKGFTEYLVETILAFVEALGHCSNAALRPRARVGTAVEGCAEQTSQANTGETWSESQPPVSRQD